VTTFRNKNGMRVSEEFFSVEVAEDGTWFRAYDDGRGEVAYQEWLEMIEQAGRTVVRRPSRRTSQPLLPSVSRA